MKNMKVSLKLIVSFMIVLALAVIVGVIGIVGMNRISTADEALYYENVVAISAMGQLREAFQDQRVQLRNMVVNAGNADAVRAYREEMVSLDRELKDYIRIYEDAMADPSMETAYFNAKKLYENDFATVKDSVYNASLVDIESAIAALYTTHVTQISASIVSGFDEAMANNDQQARNKVDSNSALFRTMVTIQIIFLVISVVVALFFALYISRLISRPLAVLSNFMKRAGTTGDISLSPEDVKTIGEMGTVRDEIGQTINSAASFVGHVTTVSDELKIIADGDLSVEVQILSDKDTMGVSLKHMLENLNKMFSNIYSSTSQVSMGSRQVADGAQALAQGATEQAAAIQQLSSSIAEISESTKTNASTADRTAKLSYSIKESAEKGSRQMDDMITAVKDINDASQSISKIIKTIDDIAFQTNILALNAAVEAARAGQHGKGFAVVAEEVRNLASKSAEAAKDTGNMIQNSMEKAELGSRIAGETATSLKSIVDGINESSQLVGEIASASEQQSLGISQINTGIEQVAHVVQQNSATAEESAAASEEMSNQSSMLEDLISQFKLKDGGSQLRGLPEARRGFRK